MATNLVEIRIRLPTVNIGTIAGKSRNVDKHAEEKTYSLRTGNEMEGNTAIGIYANYTSCRPYYNVASTTRHPTERMAR